MQSLPPFYDTLSDYLLNLYTLFKTKILSTKVKGIIVKKCNYKTFIRITCLTDAKKNEGGTLKGNKRDDLLFTHKF